MPLEKGCVQVYTGNGKGKTTASLGLILRAVGQGLKVCLVQFMKGGGPYGEHIAAERLLPELKVFRFGRDGWVRKGAPAEDDLQEAARACQMAKEALCDSRYDMVVLDEINGAVDFGLISLEQVLELIALKRDKVELVMTGRNAHEQVIQRADLVTEMREIKHYYQAGVGARVGIES